MCGAFATLSGALFLSTSAPCVAPSYGLPNDHFVTTWTAQPSTHFSAWDGAPPRIKVVEAHATGAAPAEGVLAAAFASAADERERRDRAVYELTTGWPQNERTVLADAQDARRRYVAAAARLGPTASDARSDERFAALVTQAADGTGRSATIDDRAIDGEMADALRGARARVDARRRTEVEASQTAWLAYRDALLAFAEAKSPGLAATIRGEVTERRARELAAIGR